MAKEGKRFERRFKESAEKQELLCVRFNDSDMSYNINKELRSRFTPTNPSDCFIYSFPYIYFIENKSTKSTSISFERNEKEKGMIHYKQIVSLTKLSLFPGVFAGLVLNFRDEKDEQSYSELTYYISIDNFNTYVRETTAKSINKKAIIQYGGFLIGATQKRKLYDYDVKGMIEQISLSVQE